MPLVDGLPKSLASNSVSQSGRYVRIELPKRGTLSLAEVEVFSGDSNVARSGQATREGEAARAQGSAVMIIGPDAESAAARGPNNLDLSRRGVSAEAGLRQATIVAADLASWWNGTARSQY